MSKRSALVLLDLLLLVSVVAATRLNCPHATTTNFAFTVEVIYGRNTTCSELEELAVRDTINAALTNTNITQSGGPLQEINGDICTDNGDSIDDDFMHRNLAVVQKYTWNGRMTCRLCSPNENLRGRRLLEALSTAEEAAHLASLLLTDLIKIAFVDDPESCLHQDWATPVIVTVIEVTQTPEDPCE